MSRYFHVRYTYIFLLDFGKLLPTLRFEVSCWNILKKASQLLELFYLFANLIWFVEHRVDFKKRKHFSGDKNNYTRGQDRSWGKFLEVSWYAKNECFSIDLRGTYARTQFPNKHCIEMFWFLIHFGVHGSNIWGKAKFKIRFRQNQKSLLQDHGIQSISNAFRNWKSTPSSSLPLLFHLVERIPQNNMGLQS